MKANGRQFRRQLSASLADSLQDYVDELDGEPCAKLYGTTLAVVEKGLIEFTMRHCKGNLTLSAKMLGISRTTLNRKLAAYQLRD